MKTGDRDLRAELRHRAEIVQALLLGLLLPTLLWASPKANAEPPEPSHDALLSSSVQRVRPAVVGIRVSVPFDRPSVATLGSERWGSGAIQAAGEGAVVIGVSPVGPAASAGFQPGDRIVRLSGEPVRSQEEFYARLWATQVGDEIVMAVVREFRFHAVTVRPQGRYRHFRTTEKWGTLMP